MIIPFSTSKPPGTDYVQQNTHLQESAFYHSSRFWSTIHIDSMHMNHLSA